MPDQFVDKVTVLKKSQPVRMWTHEFKEGFKVGIEFNFSPYDPTDIDKLLQVNSDLRTALRAFIKMVEEDTHQKLVKDNES